MGKGVPTGVSAPVPASMENTEMLFEPAFPTYKNAPAESMASSVGAVRLRAKVTQEIRPDCVCMLHGFGKRSPWLKRAYNRGGSDAAILDTAWDKVSGNAAMHETFVRVRKIEAPNA